MSQPDPLSLSGSSADAEANLEAEGSAFADRDPEPYVHDINMLLSRDERDAAILAALQERPDNAPPPDIAGRLSLAVARNRRWANGRTLRVKYLDARRYSSWQWRVQAVMDAASEWTRYANLTFVVSDDPQSEIRVTFGGNGCWSLIGTDARGVHPSRATLNLSVMSWRQPTGFRKYVLHEFGHAIGCVHEHQTPIAGIPWNTAAVYDFYWQTQHWDKKAVDAQVLNVFAQPSTNHVPTDQEAIVLGPDDYTDRFDPHSIMVYPISPNLTDGVFEVKWRDELSDLDKEFIASVYPKPRQE